MILVKGTHINNNIPNQTPFICLFFIHEFVIAGSDSSSANIQVESRSKYRKDLIKMEELRQALLNRADTPLHPDTHQVQQ